MCDPVFPLAELFLLIFTSLFHIIILIPLKFKHICIRVLSVYLCEFFVHSLFYFSLRLIFTLLLFSSQTKIFSKLNLSVFARLRVLLIFLHEQEISSFLLSVEYYYYLISLSHKEDFVSF